MMHWYGASFKIISSSSNVIVELAVAELIQAFDNLMIRSGLKLGWG